MDKAIKAEDYGTVAVSLVVKDAKAAIEFYKKVFGAKHLYSLTMPGGGVAHGEFKIGNTLVMISDENPQWGSKSPATLGGSPVTLNNPASSPARAYLDATRRLLGETVTMSVPAERVGLMNRLLGRRAA